MKKILLLVIAIAAVAFTVKMVNADVNVNTVGYSVAILNQKNVPFNIAPMAVVQGDSVYIKTLEIRGRWQINTAPSPIWPYKAFNYFKDTTDVNPLSRLDWTGVTLDTTWTVTNSSGIGKYSINKSISQVYQNGAYSLPTAAGWLAPNKKYYVDVYQMAAGVATLKKTLNFDPSTGDTTFQKVTFNVTYTATGNGVYPAAVPARPDSLLTANAECRITFDVGSVNKKFTLDNNADSIRYVFRTDTKTFATQQVPVYVVQANQIGVVPQVVVNTPLPASGYYSAGDTISVNLNMFSPAGDTLKWWENPYKYGINRMELLVSGPKRDYEQVFKNRYVINSYAFTYDSVARAPYSNNPIKFVLPSTLPNGAGTYTIFMGVRRVFGVQSDSVALKDIQVGTTNVDQLPVTSKIAGQSCAQCHGVNGPVFHHSSKGVDQCLVCHTDNFSVPFSDLMHSFHQEQVSVNIPMGNCTSCHVNGSENQFTNSANMVCSSCHGVVPFMPADHAATVPLYSATGLSCATANCHAGGNMGVFKNIAETHAGLAAKYTGGNVTAKFLDQPITIDGVQDAIWLRADSMKTKDNITVKFLWDSTYVYVLARWKDGHQNYSSVSGPTESLDRNKWSFNGTAWSKSGDEDKLAFVWSMTDSAGASCAKTCHDIGTGHRTLTGKMDSWIWKSARTNPIGLADDSYWSTTGIKADALTSGSFGADNINAAGTLPLYMATTAAGNNAQFLYYTTAVAFVNSGWASGNTLPGWVVNDSTATPAIGSRADVLSKGKFNAATGEWTVEFKRKINTGFATDDKAFNLSGQNPFSVAKFDAAGSYHAAQGVDVGQYNLSFSATLVPVELASLSATTKDNTVIIKWSTATETNNKGFEIERKSNDTWTKVGFVAGNGTTTKTNSYQFVDNKVSTGKYSYRLKQVDFDGTSKYSQVVEVSLNVPTRFELAQNYPNPFNPSTKITFSVAEKTNVKITVYGINGEVVTTLVDAVYEPGTSSVTFDAKHLASGIYFYRMEAGRYTEVKKMVLLR